MRGRRRIHKSYKLRLYKGPAILTAGPSSGGDIAGGMVGGRMKSGILANARQRGAAVLVFRGLGSVALAFALAGSISTRAAAGLLIPVIFPGATATTVYGINDSNEVVGTYVAPDGSNHGFFGPLGGSYTSFDAGPNGTSARAINDGGAITGTYNDAALNGRLLYEFERDPSGAITTIMQNGNPVRGVVKGINSNGTFVGDSFTVDAHNHVLENGYLGSAGSYVSTLTIPVPTNRVRPRGINDSGEVVGWYANFTSPTVLQSGFLLYGANFYSVDFPNPTVVETFLTGINNAGLAVGEWDDGGLDLHSFAVSASHGTEHFVNFDVPGVNVVFYGINNLDEIALSSDFGSFILNARPFLAPEPASIAIAGAALAGLGAARRRRKRTD